VQHLEKEIDMRKLLYVLPAVLLFGVNTAGAQDGNAQDSRLGAQDSSGGQDRAAARKNSSAPPVTSAQSVAGAKDNQPAKLRGQIVSKQGRNQYVFADDTGNAVVEIDNKVLNGQSLAAGTKVEIQGEIDKSIIKKQAKVDAKSVTVLASSGSSSSPSSPSGSGAPMNEQQPESGSPD
jgi:uncharacterized protein (TIGR00156 family)